jgi:hypothetical protein
LVLRFGVYGLEFGVWSLEFGVWSLEFGERPRRVWSGKKKIIKYRDKEIKILVHSWLKKQNRKTHNLIKVKQKQ